VSGTSGMSAKLDQPVLAFESQTAWEAWLAEHHQTSSGIWIKFAKKGSGQATVSYQQALEVALAHGWIDGQKASFDEAWWLQRFTPRTARSKWSKINRDKAADLIANGKMKPAGLREVERAKADGRWEAAYHSQSAIQVPEDLRRELDHDPRARAFFDTLDSANRYAILYRLQEAKKPETRARRLQKYIQMLGDHQKLHPD
jgi:uncharacterized protein YdeI (YjbR/CyaY-like superfamily)